MYRISGPRCAPARGLGARPNLFAQIWSDLGDRAGEPIARRASLTVHRLLSESDDLTGGPVAVFQPRAARPRTACGLNRAEGVLSFRTRTDSFSIRGDSHD